MRIGGFFWLLGCLFSFFALGLTPKVSSPEEARSQCKSLLLELETRAPVAADTASLLLKFAKRFNLPTKVVEVGPPARRVKRVVVAVNFHDWALMQEYTKWFHLEGSENPRLGGVLALEYAYEIDRTGKSYVGTNLRPRPDMGAPIWMFGREDVPWQKWWDVSVKHPEAVNADLPIVGFAHLIGATLAEQKNIWHYLYHPGDRAPVKNNNCVAWQSQIEFADTCPGSTDEQRQFLATRLGFSRTIEHAEMTRRMFHYANEQHSAIVAFVNGPKGLAVFENDLASHLPPLPKKSPKEAVKGVAFARNPELEKAIATIPDGAKVFIPIGPGASTEAMAEIGELAARSEKGIDVHLFVNGISERVFQEGLSSSRGKLRLHALFLGGNLRKLYSEGRVHYVPGYLADFAKHIRAGASSFAYDAIVLRVSPPDAWGRYSLGPNCDLTATVLNALPNIKVIAEINSNVPFTTGDNFILKDRITASFKSNLGLSGPAAIEKTPVEAAIGGYLGRLVESNSTLQVGIGSVFGGLKDGLLKYRRRNLRISTEMLGDDLMELAKSGMVTATETSFGYGSAEFYKWLHLNPDVVFKPTEFINDPSRVAAIPRFVAINTAIQVDLRGQSNATMGPPDRGRISSPGGQVEFMSGAARSFLGKAIIALRSTAGSKGEFSTIDTELYPGPITTPHEMVSHVVTEYGVAELAGKNERDRAVGLINIAHPKFRRPLAERAVQKNMLRAEDLSLIDFVTTEMKSEKTAAAAPVLVANSPIVELAKQKGVPLFFRKVHGRDIPVVLLNSETYPKLKPFLDQSLGTAVKMFPFDHRGTDHGSIRLGANLIDFYWPGADKFGQIHHTGVFWLSVPEYLKRRDENSQRIIEATYTLTDEEKKVAEYYHRMRRAGVFQARYEFSHGDPGYDQRPHVLGDGFENCYSYGVNGATLAHLRALKQGLSQLGVPDVDALLALPAVREFQKKAMAQLLAVDRSDPRFAVQPRLEEAVLNIHLFDKSEYDTLLSRALPTALSSEQKTKFLNFLVGLDAAQRYDELGKKLGLGGNFWNFNHDRVSAIVIWDSPLATPKFRDAAYEEGGSNPAYQFRDTQFNTPVK